MSPAAARFADPIAHTSTFANALKMLGSLAVGAAVGGFLASVAGAALGVATIATGGLALVATLAIGFAVSMVMEATGFNAFVDRTIDSMVDSIFPPVIEGTVASGSPDIFINSMKAARAAAPSVLDIIACNMHASGPPPMIAQGSDNVFFNDQPAARVEDKTTCGGSIAAGSGDVFIGGGTLTVREIADERPWWLSALGVGIGVALALCGRGKMNWQSLKSALPCLAMNMGASFAGSAVGHMIKTAVGNPVNVITGGKVLNETSDFFLSGALPLVWERFYSSHDLHRDGLLGPGWSVPYEVQLQLENDAQGQLHKLHYTDEQGRVTVFPALPPGSCHCSIAEGIYLICTEMGQYLVESVDGLYRDFGVPAAGWEGICRLQAWEDRNGNRHTLRYAGVGDGRLQRIGDKHGRSLSLHYDHVHPQRVAAVVLERGVAGEVAETLVQYRYTAEGELATVIARDGQTLRQFAYQHGLMVEHSAPGGLRCHYQWRGEGSQARVIRHHTDDGESYYFDYDLERRQVSVSDQSGRSQHWQWNADQQPHTYTDAEGHEWQYTWNEHRQLLSVTDPCGARSCCEYDEQGRLSRSINALDQIETTVWHPKFELPLQEIDACGARWAYEYDLQGNLTASVDPLGHRNEYHYDSQGMLHTVRDARGGNLHYAWNRAAQLTAYTDCSGRQTHFVYDARGALAQVTDAAGQSTHYQHDAMGRLISVLGTDDSRREFAYDPLGRLQMSIDANGQRTHYRRNRRGQLIERIDAQGHTVQFHYDAAQRLCRLQNENGESYRFEYDRNDQLLREIGLDGNIKQTDYDARGLPLRVTDAHGTAHAQALELERDALGRLIAKQSGNIGGNFGGNNGGNIGGKIRTHYRYDHVGRLLQAQRMRCGDGQALQILNNVEFVYNARGEIESESGHAGRLLHSYDELGTRTATTLADGRVLNFLHYGSGHLHQINLDGESISDIERDVLHREVLRSQGSLCSRFAYDSQGRKVAHQVQRSVGADPLKVLEKQWQYDLNGELVSKRHMRHGTAHYRYDHKGQIVAAQKMAATGQAVQEEIFAYDAAANLVDSGHPGGYVKHNRVQVLADKRYEYDVYGRLRNKRSGKHTYQSFRYDEEHRLTEVRTTRNGSRQTVSFEYDALGRRIAKTDAFGSTRFVWDGMRLLQEQRGSVCATYVYEGADSYVPLARLERVQDVPLAPGRTSVDKVFYFHNEISGLPEELSSSSGHIVWQAQYDTWGNTVQESWSLPAQEQIAHHGTVPLAQNLRFQGQYLDRETGLHYNTFRFYDPDIGRFISPDPIGLMGGMNLHAYAPNPIAWVDPWGWASTGNVGEYQVYGEARITRDLYRASDYRHFQDANRQLYHQMSTSPELKSSIESKYPGTYKHVSPGKFNVFKGTPPPNLSWHHHEKVGGLLQLVDRDDHNSRQKDYHPSGKGGRNTWGGGSGCR